MLPASSRPKGLLERPGRLAAVGGAAAVCVLAVSGALGFSATNNAAEGADSGGSSPISDVSGGTSHPGVPAPGGGPAPGSIAARSGSGRASGPDEMTGRGGDGSSQQDSTLPAGSGTGRRVVFEMSRQRVWLVDAAGRVSRSYPVSGSKYDNLNPGTYSVSSRSAHATAYNSAETMRYMVRFAFGRTAPIGFHSIPVLAGGGLAESRSQLGTPQSDGCIRQWITDAKALWDFAPVGTEVVVLA